MINKCQIIYKNGVRYVYNACIYSSNNVARDVKDELQTIIIHICTYT